jgi:uncharacterized membrane protein
MSQMPPPPPSQPAPMGGPPASSNKNLYTVLAWAALPPIGSLIMLFVGKDDPDVKYNAASAFIIHGAALIVWIILRIIAAAALPLVFLLIIFDVIWFVIWLVGFILALQAGGRRVEYPVLGPLAASYVPMVESWAK